MKDSHAHMKITEREWDRMVAVFRKILAKHNVPAKEAEELVKMVGTTKADIVMAES